MCKFRFINSTLLESVFSFTSYTTLIQSEVKPTPIATPSHTFSCASCRLHVFTVSWLVHQTVRVLYDWVTLWYWFYEIQYKPLWVREILMCVPVELVRYCTNMLYLSLAYCTKFTNKGLSYMANGKGCHKIVHLDLSGCEQVREKFSQSIWLGIIINYLETD